MAAGCPIVAADTPGFRHVMTDGVQGFMVDLARDPDASALAERTNRLLTDPVLRRRCVEAGRQTAARFDWPAVTKQVLAVYDRLLNGRAGQVSPELSSGISSPSGRDPAGILSAARP
jgi:phosphatidylinositol alpha-mannosyltransferase